MAADLVVLLSRLAESPKHDDNARLAMREAAREIAELRANAEWDGKTVAQMRSRLAELRQRLPERFDFKKWFDQKAALETQLAELRQALLFKKPDPFAHEGLSCIETEDDRVKLFNENVELRQRERALRAVPKASPRKAISADYATGYNHALETVLAILDKATTETKDSK